MTDINAIGYAPDYQTTTKSTSTGGTSAYSTIADILAAGGPAAMIATDGTSAGSITAAAINGAYSGTRSASGSYGYMPSSLSVGGSSLSTMGAYSSGGANLTTTTGSSTDVESILSESAMSQAYMIGLQSQMGTQSVMTNAMSNAINMKDMGMLSVIRNFKTA